jgi:signal peptidase I
VLLVKDGDFALVLVMMTLLSAVVSGLDHFLFASARIAYVKTEPVKLFINKYIEEQRLLLSDMLGKEFVVAEYAKSFFPVLFVVLVLRSFIVEPFQIPSASMVPTLEVGDYILVNKFKYGIRLPVLGTKVFEVGEPQRGDVMVFFPPHKDIYFIKRVIGLPGDQVTYTDKVLKINGEVVGQTLLAELPPLQPVVQLVQERLGEVNYLINNDMRIFRGNFSITVKPGHYFMMGDNRDNSSDSRVWGQVPEERIVGQAFAIWMHWASFTELPSFGRVGTIQ